MKLRKYGSKINLLIPGLIVSIIVLLGTLLWGFNNRYVINETQARQIAFSYAVQDCLKRDIDAGVCSRLKVDYENKLKEDLFNRDPPYWEFGYGALVGSNSFNTTIYLDRTGQKLTLDKGGVRLEVK